MVVAEISLTPIGTADSSLSFYIAKSIESINDIKGVKHITTSMGTI
ncbi:MAG TPA: thiamine-binding protein, partial [Candidatus Nitrosotenuis sp.]|nr:thiamine-binding protein [Candidatus Nitrosotenuis sp.]